MGDADKLFLDILGKTELAAVIELIQESLSCETPEQFRALVEKLGKLIRFDYSIAGFVTSANGELRSYSIISTNYPPEWLKVYEGNGYPYIDPLVRENFATFELQYWKDTYRKHMPPRKFIMDARDFKLNDGYTIGARNRNGSNGSIFTISSGLMKQEKRTGTVLRVMAPHLHNCMARIQKAAKKQGIKISFREKEVLSWLKEGKSSWDISEILHVSENTVNFHIKNIMQKLDTVNRSQAVAKALEAGVIDFE